MRCDAHPCLHRITLIDFAQDYSERDHFVQDKATVEMLRVELEGWGRFQKVLDESRPKKG